MKNGGARAGAGRPKGIPNRKTQEIIQKAAAEGVMPLDVLLDGMRYYYKLYKEIPPDVFIDAIAVDGYRNAAKEYAIAAAPYLHPKLASVEATLIDKTAEERLERLRELLN